MLLLQLKNFNVTNFHSQCNVSVLCYFSEYHIDIFIRLYSVLKYRNKCYLAKPLKSACFETSQQGMSMLIGIIYFVSYIFHAIRLLYTQINVIFVKNIQFYVINGF